MYILKAICFLLILTVVLSTPATAEHIKVDIDTRSDSTAAGFLSWKPSIRRQILTAALISAYLISRNL